MYNKITYYHTLYKREETDICGEVEFQHDETHNQTYVVFASMGRKHMIEAKYVRKIEPIED